MADFWIAEIRISAAMEQKIRTRRFVTGDDVRRACVPDQYESAGWHDHPEHGRRLLVVATTPEGLRLKIILFPVSISEGIWRWAQFCDTNGMSCPDEFAEFETTEAEFDAMMAKAEPARVVPPPLRVPRQSLAARGIKISGSQLVPSVTVTGALSRR